MADQPTISPKMKQYLLIFLALGAIYGATEVNRMSGQMVSNLSTVGGITSSSGESDVSDIEDLSALLAVPENGSGQTGTAAELAEGELDRMFGYQRPDKDKQSDSESSDQKDKQAADRPEKKSRPPSDWKRAVRRRLAVYSVTQNGAFINGRFIKTGDAVMAYPIKKRDKHIVAFLVSVSGDKATLSINDERVSLFAR